MDNLLYKIWSLYHCYLDYNEVFYINNADAPLFLCVNYKNYDEIVNLDTFLDILKKYGLSQSYFDIQRAQISVLNLLRLGKIYKKTLLDDLANAFDNNLIERFFFENIINFINLVNCENIKIQQQFNFKDDVNKLLKISEELKLYSDDIIRILNNFQEQNFILSVCGAVNSGKSSMLNSFLKSDILGFSNIPQTSCLTILKYGKENKIEVNFEGKKQIQNINDLKKISSTQCDFKGIDYIEVMLDNSFLAEKISIVDTPGIDDLAFYREELTKRFLKNSDAILFLINAAQPASKKDLDFVKTIFEISKNNTLILVLTHCDGYSIKELSDIQQYTKNSFKDVLSKNISHDIPIFCIDNVSKKGIEELKEYLFKEFFNSNSQKAELILKSFRKDIELLITKLIQKFQKDFSDTLIVIEDNVKEINNKMEQLAKFNTRFDEILNFKLDNILEEGKIFYCSRIDEFANSLKNKIQSDVRYLLQNNIKIDFKSMSINANNIFNDFFAECLRQYYSQINNKISKISIFFKNQTLDFDLRNFINLKLKNITTITDNILRDYDKDIFVEELKRHLNLDTFTNIFNDLLNDSTKDLIKDIDKNFNNIKVDYENKINSLTNNIEILKDKNQKLSYKNVQNTVKIRNLNGILKDIA